MLGKFSKELGKKVLKLLVKEVLPGPKNTNTSFCRRGIYIKLYFSYVPLVIYQVWTPGDSQPPAGLGCDTMKSPGVQPLLRPVRGHWGYFGLRQCLVVKTTSPCLRRKNPLSREQSQGEFMGIKLTATYNFYITRRIPITAGLPISYKLGVR